MNTLIYTTDIGTIKNKIKADFYFTLSSKTISDIEYVYNYYNNVTLFVDGLNKSKQTDMFLKILETNTKNIDLYAVSSSFDVKPAVEARFDTIKKQYLNDALDHNNIQFYINLAEQIVNSYDMDIWHNLAIVSNIIDKIRMSTNNICWDALYDELNEGLM